MLNLLFLQSTDFSVTTPHQDMDSGSEIRLQTEPALLDPWHGVSPSYLNELSQLQLKNFCLPLNISVLIFHQNHNDIFHDVYYVLCK